MNNYKNNFNPFIYKEISNNSCVLDVGCNSGILGKSLIANKKCVVEGMDINKIALNIAKKNGYKKTYLIDLDKEKISLNKKYDYIIFSDVLEHLKNPEVLLKSIYKNLKKNGQIIISVPNIAFIYYRLHLLLGNFEYKNAGVMDKTHLKFFTFNSIKKLLLKNNYKIIKIQGINIVSKKLFFLKLLDKIFPKLFSLQILIKAKK